MEGKTVIVGVIMLSLVLEQFRVEAICCRTKISPRDEDYCSKLSPKACSETPGCANLFGTDVCPKRNSVQVEETKLCCPNTIPAECYRFSPEGTCEKTPGCQIKTVRDNRCPLLQHTGAIISEYCKLGCASSVCNAISTLQISGDEVVNEAVEQCNNACSAFCTKGSILEIA